MTLFLIEKTGNNWNILPTLEYDAAVKRNTKALCSLLWGDLQNTLFRGKNKVQMSIVYIFFCRKECGDSKGNNETVNQKLKTSDFEEEGEAGGR